MRLLLLLVPLLFFVGIFEFFGLASLPTFPHKPVLEPFKSPYLVFGIYNWKRPLDPPRVGIQVGHWKHDEAPLELSQLWNNSGTEAAGIREVDINYAIAVETARILKQQGFLVDLLPTTIPRWYQADVFISVHADGNLNRNISGFKVSPPRRDITGKALALALRIESEYAKATNMPIDSNVTENMAFYYAFSWKRFEHAIHPMTPGAIVETGFVSNRFDRAFLYNNPEIPAKAIAKGIYKFLQDNETLSLDNTKSTLLD